MATRNDVTGDKIQSRVSTDAYRNSPYWEKRDEIQRNKRKSPERSQEKCEDDRSTSR